MAIIKYLKLANKHWLKEAYDTNSSATIAKTIGCTKDAVRAALVRHGIPRRNRSEASSKINKRFKVSQLNDTKWLFDKYVIEKKSLKDLCEELNVKNSNSIRQALIKAKIELRSISEGLTCNRLEDGFVLNQNVIDGCLLGDAFLRKYNKDSDGSYPSFAKRNKFRSHVKWVGSLLFDNPDSRIKDEINYLNNKKFPCFLLKSLSHAELLLYYKRWYPQNIKIIPPDVSIAPISLLNWFLDDGSSYRCRNASLTKQVLITLCTECFSKEDQEMLADKIKKEYALKIRVGPYNQGTGWRMYVPQSQTSSFYELIGSCPVKELEYKWK